ncbi:MAG: hypothetical protein KKB20_05905 [Proteobacteria bacterium]|nr:hypothetical protein [Pseudomonadota bacterium]
MGQENEKSGQRIEIRGLVIPYEWDPAGNLVGVAISTYDENEYIVEMSDLARDLMGWLRLEVVVEGRIRLLEDGTRVLEVLRARPTGRPKGTVTGG